MAEASGEVPIVDEVLTAGGARIRQISPRTLESTGRKTQACSEYVRSYALWTQFAYFAGRPEAA